MINDTKVRHIGNCLGFSTKKTEQSLRFSVVYGNRVGLLLSARRAGNIVKQMKAKVIVMPKAAVLDPQGNAVRDAMRHLGMPEVRSVRIGKYMEIDIEGQNGDFESRLHRLCRDLLSNPVIEDYELQKSEDWNHKKTPNSERLREQGARRRTPISREQASNAQHSKSKTKRTRIRSPRRPTARLARKSS